MTPLLWGAVLGAVIWVGSEIRARRKLLRSVAAEAAKKNAGAAAEEAAAKRERQAASKKRERQAASKKRVHFEEAAPEREPVTLHLGGDTWSEVWMDGTVAFQNEKTGEILQDGEEFAKLQHQR